MKLRMASLAFVGLLLIGIPAAFAQDIYDNGPTNGNIDSWLINFGGAVSDTFTIEAATVTGVNFAAWMEPGDTLESAEVSITSSEFGGTTYFDQIVSFTQSGCATNNFGFNVCTESSVFPGISLNSGTYWLNLQNAATNEGDPVYWDESNGPSSASHNDIGTVPSESFTINGNSDTSSGTSSGSTPEPTTLMLLGSGLVGTLGWLRRRLF